MNAAKAVLQDAIREVANPMALMERVVLQALELIPQADGASLEMRVGPDTLEYLCGTGTLQPYVGLQLPINSSLSGLAVRTGKVQISNDVNHDHRVNAAAVQKTGVTSMLCVPLSSDEGGVAVLKVSSQQANSFTTHDAQILQRLAQFLNIAVNAASSLARVTTDVLEEFSTTDTNANAARFVANVMAPGLVADLEMTQTIREIMSNEAIEIVVQPIFNLQTGQLFACEALARFSLEPHHTPDWWFATAHRLGLGVECELLAFKHALALIDQLPPNIRLGINIGATALMDDEFMNLLDTTDTSLLTIELTEHEMVEDYEALSHRLELIRMRGIRLSVDDMGTGYSGLSHILKLLPNAVKFDISITTNVDKDPVKQALAVALVQFAESIGANVIAEGIETPQEAQILKNLGITHGQGYFLGRPGPIEQVTNNVTFS